ncbi:MAG: transporter substrate-binding domain-containing protein [Phyllobacterium sp.]
MDTTKVRGNFRSLLPALAAAIVWAGTLAAAAAPAIPKYWDNRERIPQPDLQSVERIRFLTTIDFPPFNFVDNDGRLAGFNVDVARAICAELGISERCQIEAVPWDELQGILTGGGAEAIIAGMAPSASARETLGFSRPYFRMPARFAVPRAKHAQENITDNITGKRIGVVSDTAHAAVLGNYFPGAEAIAFPDQAAMLAALKEGKLDAAFGDGVSLSFWLGSNVSDKCCAFSGGPYMAPQFLGDGMTVAVRKEDRILVNAFNNALQAMEEKGVMAELYLKYFPNSFY